MGLAGLARVAKQTLKKTVFGGTALVISVSGLAATAPLFFSQTALATTANIDHLAFTTSAQSIDVNTASAEITVQTQNSGNTSESLDTSSNPLTVTSSSPTGEFASYGSGTCSSFSPGSFTATMASGTANKNFCYQDSTAGTYTLTATLSNGSNPSQTWSTTQSVTITDPSNIDITNVTQLRDAIENQADGQTWTIEPGSYGLAPFTDITAEGQTGWYFPITANNLTINGVGNPTIYGDSYSVDGAWATQDLIAIFGDNVTINGLTLKPKVEPNKTIEVLGSNSTIEYTTIEPNDIVDQSEYNLNDPTEKDWGGSIYYNNTSGAQTLTNVTIENGGISDHSPSSTLNLTNVNLNYSTATDWINSYRFATHGNPYTGSVNITYHVSGDANNLDDVLANAQDSDTIQLDSNLTTSQQITLTKSVTLDGNGYTISPNFTKTSSDNNAAIGVQADNVTIKNLVEDGTLGISLHGINIYASSGVTLDTVSVLNNDHDGIVVNGSSVTVNNITTSGNGWGGIDVDQGSGVTSSAALTVNGISTHDEVIPIQIDDLTKNVSVIDTYHQYSFHDIGNLRIYSLLQSDQTAPDNSGNATANSSTPQVVVSDASQTITITVAPSTTNASINYSALVSSNTGTIPQTTISAPAATVTIPASTTVTATGGTWDGTISAPTTTTVNLGSSKSVATAVEVGSDGLHLTFSNAVRLLLPGQAGKLVGFVRNGDFTQISNTCSADSQTAGDALPADGDCYISIGSDMVVWTKHFTTFVTYSPVSTPSGSSSSSSSTSSSKTTGSTGGSSSDGESDENSVLGESTGGPQVGSAFSTTNLNNGQMKAAEGAANSLGKAASGFKWYWWAAIVASILALAGTVLVYLRVDS